MRALLPLIVLSACGGGEFTDRYAPNHLTEVSIEIESEEWDSLRVEGRLFYELLLGPECFEGPPEEVYSWHEGDVYVDQELVEQVGLRKKGFIGSLNRERPSLKIDTDTWVADQTFEDGTERFTLNNNNQDDSRLHSCLAYKVFFEAGVPAPRCAHAVVSVNSRPLGVYSNVQPIKKRMLREHFESDEGELYEGAVSDFTDEWIATFEIKNEGDTLAPLEELTAVLERPDDALMEGLAEVLDLDAFMTFWAVESLIGHWDGYGQGRNNFYVYHDSNDLLYFIPWGADAVFQDPNGSAVLASSRLTTRLYNHPEGKQLFLDELQRVLDDVWDEEALHAEVARVNELIAPRLLDADAQQRVSEEIERFIDGRRVVVEAAIASPPERPVFDAPRECVDPIGTVSATFDTVWGSTEDDPFANPGTLEGEVYGQPHFNDMVGTQAGLSDEGEAQIVIIGLNPAQTTISAVILNITEDLEPGTYPVDIAATAGYAFTMDLTASPPQPQNIVFLGGEMMLGEISFEADGAVSGSVEAILIPNIFE